MKFKNSLVILQKPYTVCYIDARNILKNIPCILWKLICRKKQELHMAKQRYIRNRKADFVCQLVWIRKVQKEAFWFHFLLVLSSLPI